MGLTMLYPAAPAFFSEIKSGPEAEQLNDEYWHVHIDTRQYGSFIYTALLYLNSHEEDYSGGEFVFVDRKTGAAQQTIQPKAGMLLVFTSGEENPHHIQKVTEGTRYAVTISWTCAKQAQNSRRL
eukprot:CAMPEP_0197543972 /NCGR_PEP_ID=MMETSP1318-20131121/68521_1 /TAXON_ID=552666 /ORGANISM="Partenskyella glossopodia, Strain RCC365" /LENGTH=124 /DNA_ID=CAMNT_0043103341 /DNA_START=637 /DNA_END=1007 /DNA_ORIENTATION=-